MGVDGNSGEYEIAQFSTPNEQFTGSRQLTQVPSTLSDFCDSSFFRGRSGQNDLYYYSPIKLNFFFLTKF